MTEFSLDVVDPADLEVTWELDDMHMPYALSPLAADYITKALGASFNHHYALFGGAQTLEARVWHGYAYFGFSSGVPEAEGDAAKARWIATLRERVPVTAAYWRDEALPELRRLYDSISSIQVDELPAAALAEAWLQAWRATLRAWQIHFISIMGPYQVLEDLADQYGAAMGPGHDVEALTLTRGDAHELEAVDAEIEALTEMLRASPALADAVAEVDADGPGSRSSDVEDRSIDRPAIARTPGGPSFLEALDAFLARHGHLGQNHDDLRDPSWAEAPAILLTNLATRLAAESPATGDRLAEQQRLADDLAAAMRTALADRPVDLARLEETLALAREVGYLTEGHNYWIDRMAQARLRTLVGRVARRLVREGVLETPHDVFFLGRDEIAEAIVDGRPRQEVVQERRATFEQQQAMQPPRYVGPVPKDTGPPDRFDAPRLDAKSADELRGTGASAGIVRGPARLVASQEAFGAVQPGDIVVCPASNPSWVPVFTIAGGLVTNTGGVLSHAAVVAREFGLPAVVGVVGATDKIRDGRLVEIDGTAGTVRLL
jgi:phosphohistidine swiveling domain-containing protein